MRRLSAEQLAARSVPPSTMSLLGLLRHLARVEHQWFRRTLGGQAELADLYVTEEEPALDFDGAIGTDECTFIPGEPWEVRGVVVHMIEEYARHCGHADLDA